MDLWLDLQTQLDKLNNSIETLKQSGREYAEAERDYKILLRQECLKLRNEGLAVGLIDKTCYGIPSVADARCQRDIKEALYKANLEAINVYKLNIKIIQNQIDKEMTTSDTQRF